MTEQRKESKAEKYEYSRNFYREEAQKKFLTFHDSSNMFVAAMNEVVASHMLYMSGKNWSEIELGEYISKLIVSFTRSHFIVSDLILSSELIESSVLLRKQFELMSRLVELDSGQDLSKLIRKTPNVKHLEHDLNKLYSEYSEISHSSDIQKLDLLGYTESEKESYIAVYPVFQENSYVAARHLFLLVSQYHFWIVEKIESWFPDYDRSADCAVFTKCYEAYEQIYYKSPKFQKIGK